MFGAGIAGLAVAPSLALSSTGPEVIVETFIGATPSIDAILKAYYEPVIVAQLKRNQLNTLFHQIESKGMTVLVHAR